MQNKKWIPKVLEYGSIAPPFSIEINTIGYPDRKKKFTTDAVKELKRRILEAMLVISEPSMRGVEDISIWIKFYDTDGVHV